MCNIHHPSNAALLSGHGAPASENGTRPSSNPYAYFHGLGIDLQDFTVKFLRKPNRSGSLVTGVFNICGIYFTAGASDFDSLLHSVLRQFRDKQAWHKHCREQKKLRNSRAFIEHHPDATVLPAYLS